MALLHEQGKMKVGDRYIGESVIGSRFHCAIESTTRVGKKNAVFSFDLRPGLDYRNAPVPAGSHRSLAAGLQGRRYLAEDWGVGREQSRRQVACRIAAVILSGSEGVGEKLLDGASAGIAEIPGTGTDKGVIADGRRVFLPAVLPGVPFF